MTYPPEPWNMRASMHMSLWPVPAFELPDVPAGTEPALLGGSGLVGTAWLVYGPGSVLEYNELLEAVLVRHDGRPHVTITKIWVDSAASKQGGRELWGIPKELARFRLRSATGQAGESRVASFAADGIASAGFTRLAKLPGNWPFNYQLAQTLDGRLKISGFNGSSPAGLCAASWQFEASGPLAWLAGRRPLASVQLRDVSLRFGDEN